MLGFSIFSKGIIWALVLDLTAPPLWPVVSHGPGQSVVEHIDLLVFLGHYWTVSRHYRTVSRHYRTVARHYRTVCHFERIIWEILNMIFCFSSTSSFFSSSPSPPFVLALRFRFQMHFCSRIDQTDLDHVLARAFSNTSDVQGLDFSTNTKRK